MHTVSFTSNVLYDFSDEHVWSKQIQTTTLSLKLWKPLTIKMILTISSETLCNTWSAIMQSEASCLPLRYRLRFQILTFFQLNFRNFFRPTHKFRNFQGPEKQMLNFRTFHDFLQASGNNDDSLCAILLHQSLACAAESYLSDLSGSDSWTTNHQRYSNVKLIHLSFIIRKRQLAYNVNAKSHTHSFFHLTFFSKVTSGQMRSSNKNLWRQLEWRALSRGRLMKKWINFDNLPLAQCLV